MTKQVNNQHVLNRINQRTNQPATQNNRPGGTSFEAVLSKINAQKLVISKHATERLSQRDMQLNPSELSSVEKAVDKAASKGVKEAVIVIGDKLLVTSIQNKTIITAAHKNDMKEQIITKIDGAIFL